MFAQFSIIIVRNELFGEMAIYVMCDSVVGGSTCTGDMYVMCICIYIYVTN